MQKFCPRCGEEVEKVYGNKGLCKDCFIDKEEFVEIPDEIEFRQCSVCKDYKLGNVWKEYKTDQNLVYDLISQYEKDNVDMSASYRKKGEKYVVNVMMVKEVDEKELKQTKEVVLKPEKTQCDKCSKFRGGYYNALLQLRGNITEDSLGELMDRASDLTNEDRNDFVADVVEKHGGYDIYTSTRSMAENLVNILKEKFEMEVKRSKKLVGKEDGQKVYKSTISARIEGYKKS
ncbi:MAG: 60S ribosomal export protein NMD3 [Candidatus Nanohaloarchaeota archaeon QJJ-9]|nr:60S ribosomal export protein NMD3 [Candidatus Nanohaloarchaeota archaeon QJJ-9]